VANHTRGNYKQARKYYLKSLNYCRKHKLPELGMAMSGLGRLYLDEKLPQKAGPPLKEACDLKYKDTESADALYNLADSISSLGRLNEQLGNSNKAALYYLTALKLFEGAPTAFAFKVLDAEQMDSYPIILYRTGLFYETNGEAEKGEVYYGRALAAFENWTGLDDRPALKARVLEYRGRTLKALGRGAEAEAELKESAVLYRQVRQRPGKDGEAK